MLLNCHTYYSLCYGALSPSALMKAVSAAGYDTICLTDIRNTSAVVDMLHRGPDYGLRIQVGIDFRNGVSPCFIGIAKDNLGFLALNTFLSECLQSGSPIPGRAPEELLDHTYIIYPLRCYTGWSLRPNEYIGVAPREVVALPFSHAAQSIDRCVILQTVTYTTKREYNAHRLLRAIDTNELLSRLPVSEQGSLDEILPTNEDLLRAYQNYPEIIANTRDIFNMPGVKIEMGKMSHKNKRCYTGTEEDDLILLRKLCRQNINYRYTEVNSEIVDRLEKELKIIEQMRFASYFLINWDIIEYARSQNYFYVGRGSGANSIVAYLLRITDVDPIDLDLYFERFINPYRNNPPDFDIDFSWTDRDDMIAYIFRRFGADYTALLGSYTTFQHDSVIRELGKVFGLPSSEIDRLQRIQSIDEADSMGKLVLQYSNLIAGFPSHLSIHASGILISEEPIHTYSATFLPPKGYATTQFSMLEAEDIGLAKFDILSQRGLSKIKDTVEIIKANYGVDIDIHNIQKLKEDKNVKNLLRRGDCIGCFYIESPAMRMLLTKLQADDYLRLVAASSIIRPGVSKSGMMSEYILRYRDPRRREKARQALPELYHHLDETYGVMVYQEDVIRIAHLFAGLSLAEADYLRRGMNWKFQKRNEFQMVQNLFFQNCKAKGYPDKTITDIWNQIESFANFAFSKAHSASYAVESLQALYLKAYYPLEYMVATLNNGGGYYSTEFYVHEARMLGASIHAPHINLSDVITRIQARDIYLGFQMIYGITADTVSTILTERNRNGDYESLEDFIQRIRIGHDQLSILIRMGAFSWTGKNKKELLWQAHFCTNPVSKPVVSELFKTSTMEYHLPPLEHSWYDDAFDEIELLGFALCSPFQLLRDMVSIALRASDLHNCVNQRVQILGYLCTTKRTTTSKGEKMYFGTFIDQEGNWIDTVHFPDSARKYPIRGKGCYLIEGLILNEYDHISIQVDKIIRLATIQYDDISQKSLV